LLLSSVVNSIPRGLPVKSWCPQKSILEYFSPKHTNAATIPAAAHHPHWALVYYGLALLWLGAVVTEALALIVVAFGVVATAVCILLGPVFIPFFIVPQLDWLFWGWLKAFIQYAFYQVVAAAVLYVVSQFTYGIIHAQITGLMSPTDLIRISPVLVVMYLAAIYAIVKVPMLTSHIFSGTAGGSAMVIFEKVAAAIGAAA